MPEKLKDIFFSNEFIDQLGDTIHQIHPVFDTSKFNQLVFGDNWEDKELKAKMRHVTHCLHTTLPDGYPQALTILEEIAPEFSGFDAMVFPDYVECYGLDDWDLSLPALALFTQYSSSEFAIRPFLAQDPERGMAAMRQWAGDENHHLRRLASEGCRPRLPWAMALPAFKKDPSPILPILEMLKNDNSDYVRRSVANNLNDISKDNPDVTLEICEQWHGHTKHTDWIVKHACRGLLKAGNKRALLLFGFADPTNIAVENLVFNKQTVAIGDEMQFTFDLNVNTTEPCRVRLEYGVDYVKATGKVSRKIFQIKEAEFEPGSHIISKKQSFVDRSTRKHHPGQHQIAVIVNGVEKAKDNFLVTEPYR